MHACVCLRYLKWVEEKLKYTHILSTTFIHTQFTRQNEFLKFVCVSVDLITIELKVERKKKLEHILAHCVETKMTAVATTTYKKVSKRRRRTENLPFWIRVSRYKFTFYSKIVTWFVHVFFWKFSENACVCMCDRFWMSNEVEKRKRNTNTRMISLRLRVFIIGVKFVIFQLILNIENATIALKRAVFLFFLAMNEDFSICFECLEIHHSV